jgi:hypothetical protein
LAVIPSLRDGTVGFTKSERFLAELCERTFLSLWSHPNLFCARNRELTDLAIIFGQDVVLFSDKSCECKDGRARVVTLVPACGSLRALGSRGCRS